MALAGVPSYEAVMAAFRNHDALPYFCGIDFGTSNSTVALATEREHFLVPVEDTDDSIPSAVFFNITTGSPAFGRAAIRDYMAGENGRLMRALKSVFGRPVFHEQTRIGNRHVTLANIVSLFLRHLKATTERRIDRALTDVVLGRPVQFVDDAPDRDMAAQNDLEEAARKIGFKNIEFQFEPIAAALEYESTIRNEEIVLIVDIGGGTSDFSIVRVGPERATLPDRTDDILANRGIRVGGTDFDRELSVRQVMPEFGYGSTYGDKNLEMPKITYSDLSTWSNINSVYEYKVAADIKAVRREAAAPELLDRLLSVIASRSGHRLIGDVERAKIALSADDKASVDLAYVEPGLTVPIRQQDFERAIAELVARIEQCLGQAVADAGVPAARINTVFLTGGSSMARPVQALIRRMFPEAAIASGDAFGAVGKGLGLDAKRKFR